MLKVVDVAGAKTSQLIIKIINSNNKIGTESQSLIMTVRDGDTRVVFGKHHISPAFKILSRVKIRVGGFFALLASSAAVQSLLNCTALSLFGLPLTLVVTECSQAWFPSSSSYPFSPSSFEISVKCPIHTFSSSAVNPTNSLDSFPT